MLDLGATSHEENLVQFALMGQAFYNSLVGKENPSVALLNVGSEEQKAMNICVLLRRNYQTRNLR